MISSEIINLYKNYFYITNANTERLRQATYRIRYQVYCKEFRYERLEDHPNEMEADEYDEQSLHCALIHKSSGNAAGCVRLVMPYYKNLVVPLPFESCCAHAMDKMKYDISTLDRSTFGEISRLAVLGAFRRRKTDEQKPISMPDQQVLVESGRQTFPILSMSLCLGMASMLLNSKLDLAFAMMEPRLTRMLKRYGIVFQQIGDVVDYHGMRGPFVIYRNTILPNLRSDALALFRIIDRDFTQNFSDCTPSD